MSLQHENHDERIYQYLREYKRFGDMFDNDEFNQTVAHEMGMDPSSQEFKDVQQEAEDLLSEEINNWLQEQRDVVPTEEEEEADEQPVRGWRPPTEEEEDVQYISVDFADREMEESPDDDLALAGKRIDIQVYHMDNTEN